jgi:hypothetical protein
MNARGWVSGCIVTTIMAAEACSSAHSGPELDGASTASTVTLTTVEYYLDWEWGNATPIAAGGWLTTTNLDYQVHVQDGYLMSHRITLIACHETALLAPGLPTWRDPQRSSRG